MDSIKRYGWNNLYMYAKKTYKSDNNSNNNTDEVREKIVFRLARLSHEVIRYVLYYAIEKWQSPNDHSKKFSEPGSTGAKNGKAQVREDHGNGDLMYTIHNWSVINI